MERICGDAKGRPKGEMGQFNHGITLGTRSPLSWPEAVLPRGMFHMRRCLSGQGPEPKRIGKGCDRGILNEVRKTEQGLVQVRYQRPD